MKHIDKGRAVLVGVAVLGILLRIVVFAFQQQPQGDDGLRYLQEACNIADFHVFSQNLPTNGEAPSPTAHDMPLWPFIMAVFLFVFGSIDITIILSGFLNILLFSLSIKLLISILKNKPFEVNNYGIAIAVGIFSFIPGSICYSLFYMPDQLAVTLVVAAIFFYFKGLHKKTNALLIASFFFGLAIWTKPICLPLALAYIFVLLFVLEIKFYKRVLWVFFCVLVMSITLFPWFLRNKIVYDEIGLTTISGTNLYSCNWRWMVASWPPEKKDKVIQEDAFHLENAIPKNANLMAKSKILGDYAKKRLIEYLPEYFVFTMKSHPRLYVGTGIKAFFAYIGYDVSDEQNDEKKAIFGMELPLKLSYPVIFSIVFLIVFYILIIAGFFSYIIHLIKLRSKARKVKNNFKIIAFLSVLLSVILLAAVIGPVTATRYRFIMNPFFAMMGSFLCDWCSKAGGIENETHLQD